MPRITKKGQVTVPKAIRDALKLAQGSEVEFYQEGERFFLKRADNKRALQRWIGYLKGVGQSDELLEALRGEPES